MPVPVLLLELFLQLLAADVLVARLLRHFDFRR